MSKFRASGKFGPSRSNTGSSIRGRVISNPIPIDDEDFPIRTPGTGIAIPLGRDGEEQIRLRSSTGTDLENIMEKPVNPVVVSADQMGSTSTSVSAPGQERSVRHASPPASGAVRNSTTSNPAKSNMAVPQRKKSSLRTVFGRLFGKKRKSNASSNGRASSPAGGARAGLHRSDPSAFARSTGSSNPQKRSASLPIDEYNRALRSHSTVIDSDDFSTEEIPDTNNGASVIANGQTRPRRATTPSRLWTPTTVPPGFATDWTGLTPRPASSHARGSKAISSNEAEAGIGMAVTSGSHPNRRSRSVGELRAIVTGPSVARRRSDEIRYWRESYDPGLMSPMSSNRAEEPILSDDGDDPQVEPEEPPQPFNFGPMGELAGMKITEAASLETRVQRLESRMQKTEKAVLRIHHHQSTEALQLQDPPRRHNKLNGAAFGNRPSTGNSESSLPKHQPRHRTLDARPDTGQYRSSSHGSSRPGTVDTNAPPHSLHNFPLSNLPNQELATTSQIGRPLSTSTTIRGIPSSSPTISKDGSFTAEHLSYLTNSILIEQTARHELEKLVHNLSQQIQALKSSNASYPTPDSEYSRKVDEIAPGTVPNSEFSKFEHDDSSDEEVRYEEVFQTPNEENPHFTDDTFGDVMSGGETKPTSRTMSLSRMTEGKGVQLV